MKEKEFKLSEKDESSLWFKAIEFNLQEKDYPVYKEKDVKEAVRRLTPKLFHDIYEEIAEEIGWETHRVCRVKFDELPELNQLTMIKTIQKIKSKIFGDKLTEGEK